MKMKKFLMIISAAVMSLCLTACSGEGNSNGGNSELSQGTEVSQSSSTTTGTDSNSEVSQTSSTMSTENVSSTESSEASSSATTESSSENSEVSAPSSSMTTESETPVTSSTSSSTSSTPVSEPTEDDVKILVAYFSATNNTEGVAQKLADGLGADLYEITPEQPYTSADLDYGNSKSRSSVEMNDTSARPAISGSVENMGQYDVVLIGYPIWWGDAPRIMNTFIESYDFSGKTLAAFCTSASSGFGNSDSTLRSAASDATWLKGQRFSAGASAADVMKWANGLGIN